MKIMKNDEAVSPVIGVILMVAITVILAAVIAAFVFGLAGTTSTSKNVGLTVTQNADGIGVITIQGGTDLPTLNTLEYSLDNANFKFVSGSSGGTTTYTGNLEVGTTVFTQDEQIAGKRLVIRGTFDDGSKQILFDRKF